MHVSSGIFSRWYQIRNGTLDKNVPYILICMAMQTNNLSKYGIGYSWKYTFRKVTYTFSPVMCQGGHLVYELIYIIMFASTISSNVYDSGCVDCMCKLCVCVWRFNNAAHWYSSYFPSWLYVLVYTNFHTIIQILFAKSEIAEAANFLGFKMYCKEFDD